MKEIHNLRDRKTSRKSYVTRRHLQRNFFGEAWKTPAVVERSFAVNTVWDEHKLAIEIQSGLHDDALRSEYDAERLAYLGSRESRVIRSAVLEQPPRLRQ